MRKGETNILERCKSLEEEIIQFQQKVAVLNIRSAIRQEALPFRRESSKNHPEDIRCNIAERFSQHSVFLEAYLALVSNTATDALCESGDIQELMLRAARSLLRAIHDSAPLRSVEMDLCRKALNTLAQACSKQCAGISSPLQSTLASFIAESIAEMVHWQEPFEHSRLESLASCMESLATVQTFGLHITTLLLDKLLQFANFIKHLKASQQGLAAEYFDRTFFLLRCTEKALPLLTQLSHLDCCELSETAQTLLKFSVDCQEAQPLFACYLSDLLARLDSLTKQKGNEPRSRRNC